jgi:hypothetical protein
MEYARSRLTCTHEWSDVQAEGLLFSAQVVNLHASRVMSRIRTPAALGEHGQWKFGVFRQG